MSKADLAVGLGCGKSRSINSCGCCFRKLDCGETPSDASGWYALPHSCAFEVRKLASVVKRYFWMILKYFDWILVTGAWGSEKWPIRKSSLH